jgi:hypothetical protein
MTDRRLLRDQEYAGTLPTVTESTRKVNRYRAHIMGHEDATLPLGKSQHFTIPNSFQTRLYCAEEIDAWFAKSSARDNGEIQIGIREEPDAHDVSSLITAQAAINLIDTSRAARGSPISTSEVTLRVRSSLAHRSVFTSLNGMADASNSSCLSSR